jgi:RNA polymerase sigma-70 factor (TIGR02960 family)
MTGVATADLVDRARAGDGEAFRRLTGPHRRELQVHCYRMLGSVQDAEDALQETMLAAWRGLDGFEGRASLRTWLYQVATSRCLNALRAARRRPEPAPYDPGAELPEPTRLGEVTWLQPYPDELMAGLADRDPGPEARYERREAISLAFVTALQLLPPRQRAVLILRDVLGFRASETAAMLETTQESVTSALKRARATIAAQDPGGRDTARPPEPGSAAERELTERFTRAFETRDLDALVALLADDVRVAMPPVPLEYHGRDLAARFFAVTAFRPGRSWRLRPARANGQPAFAVYNPDPHSAIAHANGLLVVTLAGDRVSGLTRFDNAVLGWFGFPRTVPD